MAGAANKRNGFTLLEAILSLAILALLLSASAVAMHASLQSYHENDRIAAASQTARSVLSRMMTDIRTASAVSYAGTCLTITSPGGETIQYELLNGDFYYRRTAPGTPVSYVLIGASEQVRPTVFAVVLERPLDPNGQPYTKSATAKLTLAYDGKTLPLTASSSVRRNQQY